MTIIAEQETIRSSFPLNNTAIYTRDAVWKSSSLIESYLDHIRDDLPMHHPQIEIMTHLIATRRPAVTRFLDLGCGDGILSSTLLRHYPAAQGVLADVSDQMLEIARGKLQKDASRLTFRNLNLGDSAWRSEVAPYGPFDVVISGYAIHHLHDRDKQQLYRTIYDLLAPGGLFINIEYVAAATAWGESMFIDYLIDQVYTAKRRRGEGITRTQLAKVVKALMETPDDRPAPVEQQCGWLRECGFVGVDCFFKLLGFAVFGGQRPAF